MTRRESPPTEPVYRGSVWSPLKPWGPIEKRKDQQPPVIDPLDTPEMREFINRLGQGIKFRGERPVGTATVDPIPFLGEFRQYQDLTDQFGPSQAPAGPHSSPFRHISQRHGHRLKALINGIIRLIVLTNGSTILGRR